MTDQQAVLAHERCTIGESCRKIANDLKVSGATIENIANGKTYKHLSLQPLGPLKPLVPDNVIERVRNELEEGKPNIMVAKDINLTPSVVSSIRRGSSGHHQSRFKNLSPLPTGRRQGRLSDNEVREIRRRGESEPRIHLANEFGISRQLITDIIKRRRYHHID